MDATARITTESLAEMKLPAFPVPTDEDLRHHLAFVSGAVTLPLSGETVPIETALAAMRQPPMNVIGHWLDNELADFAMVIRHCSTVYSEVSGGRISKPTTLPEEVLAVANDLETERVEEAIAEALAAEREKIEALLSDDGPDGRRVTNAQHVALLAEPGAGGADQEGRVSVTVSRRSDDADTISFDGSSLTTVRACRDCGVLIVGGPTRCLFCADRRGFLAPPPAPAGCGLCGGAPHVEGERCPIMVKVRGEAPQPAPEAPILPVCLDCPCASGGHVHVNREDGSQAVRYPTPEEWNAALRLASCPAPAPARDEVLAVECRLVDGGCGARSGEPCWLARPRSSNDPFSPDFALKSHPARVRLARLEGPK